MKTTKFGFTMIELIFVIVIIGILAAVALPRLAVNRTEAQATICMQEAGQLLNEITGQYTKRGYSVFKDMPIEQMTNIKNLESTASNKAGQNFVQTGEIVHGENGINYYCDGEAIVNFKSVTSGQEYNLTIKPAIGSTSSPVSSSAAAKIKKNMTDNAEFKILSI